MERLPQNSGWLKKLHENQQKKYMGRGENDCTDNDQEKNCQARWPLFKLQSENTEDAAVRTMSTIEKGNLHNILSKIKESVSTSVVQVLLANERDSTTDWTNIVTGVACLTETQEYQYFIQVGLIEKPFWRWPKKR